MTSAETFTTRPIPKPRRVDYWNDIAASTFGDIAVDPLTADFSGQLQRRRIGKATMAAIASAPARVEGARGGCLRPSSDGWFLLLNERGSSRMSQCGREICLQPGELTLLHASKPYQIEFTRANQTIVLHSPGPHDAFDLDAAVASKPRPEDTAVMAALLRKAHMLHEEHEGAALRFHRIVADLAALCWPAAATAPEKQAIHVWEQRVTEFVDRHLDDPSLSAASIANRYGVSARFIHKVFARTGQTASAYITGRRLALAAKRLRSEPEARITDIAIDAGFTDLSRFCRQFRAHYGTSARDWRRGD